MNILRIAGVILLAVALMMPLACEMSRHEEDTGDSITIGSAAPGKHDTLTVTGAYALVSADYGDIDIGFNTDAADPGAYILFTNATKTVAAGTGTYELTVHMTPTNWPSGTVYSVCVSLSVPLHSVPWRPLADARMDFTFDEE